MLFQNLANKKIAIWGQGREGMAVKKALEKYTPSSDIFFITEENTHDIQTADVLIKSPGVSLYRNEIIAAKEKGIYCTSSTNLFFKNRNKKSKIIAVSGTKGKSTTSSLLYHTLNHLGFKTALGGNIGIPLIELLEDKSDFIVTELSSYQTADLDGHIDIAILTNLYHEHLQWHLSHEQYYTDKINMLCHSGLCIVNGNQTESINRTNKLNRLFFNTKNSIHFENGFFYDNDEKLFSTKSLNLKGEHNLENATAVLTALKELKIDLKQAEIPFSSFKPLRHRLEILGKKDSLLYIDDSISTTPETSLAAVKAFDEGGFITLFVGGMDRGQDYQVLIDYIKTIKERFLLICLPDTGKQAYDLAQKENILSFRATNMEEAVFLSKKFTKQNGTVILSPGAPSYNLYKNFEERGDDFKIHVFK